ncbi:MAG: CYTH and CHAD domain-containing protein [Pseudonocardiales bacterium]
MTERYVEREVKLDADDGFVLPELSGFVPAGGILDTALVHLDSTYFDTADRHLLNAQVTLRSREGGPTDTGWQLKLPTGDDRTEVRVPPSEGSGVPKELRDLTAGLRRGRGLRQLARIRSERTTYRLSDASGNLLVEVADDRVRATTFGASTLISAWREVEVEAGSADDALIGAIVKRLRAAGARPSDSPSKLSRAVAEPAAGGGAAPPADDSTVGGIVMAYLREQRQALLDGDLELRGGFDAIHPTRVGGRRFRSTLRTYRALFDQPRAAGLDTELRWYSGVLGAVRDIDVLRAHLRKTIAELPDHLVLGPVAQRVEQDLVREREQHRRTLLRVLNGRRYLALLTALDDWVSDPPFTDAARRLPKQAAKWADHAQKKLDRRLHDAAAHPEDAEQVHRARKAAKRARYAMELATPAVEPKLAKQRIKQTRAIQDTLGEFQDSVVAEAVLLRMGIRAGTTPGENGFTYGLIYALEQRRADQSRAGVLARLR